jgi:hypothetical protein
MPANTEPTFTPDWAKYKTTGLTVSQLDSVWDFAKSKLKLENFEKVFGSSKIGAIISTIVGALYLVLGLAYIIARAKLVDEQMNIDRQTFESNLHQAHNNQNNINT